jgi:3-isopropylmalate dehydrogenase
LRELTGGIILVKKEEKTVAKRMTLVHTLDQKCSAYKRFELAMTRTKKLCCVDKANVLETSRLWRDRTAMEKDYPEVSKLWLMP